jgi:hypothetical protein
MGSLILMAKGAKYQTIRKQYHLTSYVILSFLLLILIEKNANMIMNYIHKFFKDKIINEIN